jgi:hypothetical protein
MSEERQHTITETIGDEVIRGQIIEKMAEQGYTVLSIARYSANIGAFWVAVAQHNTTGELREAVLNRGGFRAIEMQPTYRIAVQR